uniref:SMAUG/ZCCHC2-like PHAT domain-containing protein n=1 Tax=Leptobrachium leishanense TaxID=445787 RepID=A0A8C5M1D3_9ANUR
TPGSNYLPGSSACQCSEWAVYEWSVLARDGLRDLYNPLELRFPGSCLEDLAQANILGMEAASALHQLAQSACYSRFIAYLALLQLVRWLLATTACCSRQTLIFPWSPGAVAPPTGSAGELLLYTMASLHPAFSFFQRLSLRERLNHLRPDMIAQIPAAESAPSHVGLTLSMWWMRDDVYFRHPPSPLQGRCLKGRGEVLRTSPPPLPRGPAIKGRHRLEGHSLPFQAAAVFNP